MKRTSRKPRVDRKKQREVSATLVSPDDRVEITSMAQITDLRGLARPTSGRLSRIGGGEFGASGTLNVDGRILNTDYNVLFAGKNAMPIFDQMDRSDGMTGAAGEIIKMPIRSARWSVVPPDDPNAQEKAIADAVNEALFDDGMFPAGEGWDFTLRHLLMRVTHGFGALEKVWMFDEDRGVFRFRRLAPRLPSTVDRFEVNPDGSLKAMIQYAARPGSGRFEYLPIPAEYLCLSVREREGDNFFGKSVYRRLYKHWFYKDEAYRIEGIRLDRYGVGIPVAKLEAGYSGNARDLQDIEWVLRALRSHESAWIVEPPLINFRIMVPENGTGGATGTLDYINHHDSMIVRGVLAGFLSDHAEGLNTNRTATLADVFLHALKGEARGVRDDVSTSLVRAFCDVNFDMADVRYPVVMIAGIGDLTVDQLQLTLAPLIASNAITPEDNLENVLRKLLGLPPLPKGWERGATKPAIPAPGAPGAPGGSNTLAAGGKAGGPASADVQSNADANAKKGQRNAPVENSATPPDPIQLAAAIGDAIVEGIEAARPAPVAPPEPDPRIDALIENMREINESIDQYLQPPPPLPPIVLNMGGRQVVKKLVRGTDGRIEGIITQGSEDGADPIELYTGQPRDPKGEFWYGKEGGGATRVGITSARPESKAAQVFKDMQRFEGDLKQIPNVRGVRVQPGVGQWAGGKEPTWVVEYDGNGQARKLLAQWGKATNQDAVLVMKANGTSPSIEFSFDKAVSSTQRDAIAGVLDAHGIGGWTWYKDQGRTVLRAVSVPQWGGDAAKHREVMKEISALLHKHGQSHVMRETDVDIEVMERSGDRSYDKVLKD